jgi:heat shock protein HtpX
MAVSSVGLQTHIWNNNIKSVLLLAGFPILLVLMLWAGAYLYHATEPDAFNLSLRTLAVSWHFAFIVAAIWFSIAFFTHQRLIDAASGAHPVTRQEQPKIYNMLENLCISRGIPMPKLAIINTLARNAFASGISDKNYTVTLTQGLVDELSDDELEAVIAHELTHIMNKDVRLLIITVIFVGMISFMAEMLFRSMRYGGRSRSRGHGNGKIMIIAAIVLAVGYVFAIVLRFAISRKREYLADAGAVELTKNPDAMIAALEKISGRATLEAMPAEVAQMCIENDPKASFLSLFATHPPIEKRIEALRHYANGRSTLQPTADAPMGPWG